MSKYAIKWDGETVTLKDGSLAFAQNLKEATKLISEFVWQWRHGFIGPSGRLTAVPEAAGYWGGHGRKAYILKRNGFPCGILRIEKVSDPSSKECVKCDATIAAPVLGADSERCEDCSDF